MELNIEDIDVNILLSIINLKLRDYYNNLDLLCEEMDINKKKLEERLKEANFVYDINSNQFK